MVARKSFALRIDPAVHAAIERWAADEFRSTNGQIEFLLRQAVRDAGRLGNSGETDSEKTSSSGDV